MPYNKNNRGYHNKRNHNNKKKKGLIYKINENLIMKWSILAIVLAHFSIDAFTRVETINQIFGDRTIADFGNLLLKTFHTFLMVFLPLVLIKYIKVKKAKISLNSIGRKAIFKRIATSLIAGLVITLFSYFSANNGGEPLLKRYFEILMIQSLYIFLTLSALIGVWKGFSFIFDAEKQHRRRYNNRNNYNKNKGYNRNNNNKNRTYSNR